MDLKSLPPELLMSILKYNSAEDNYKLRNTNQYVDFTANMYSDLRRMPLFSMTYKKINNSNEDSSWHIKLDWNEHDIRCKNVSITFICETEEIANKRLALLTSKVEVTNELGLSVLELNDSLYSVIEKNKKAFRATRESNRDLFFRPEVLGNRYWRQIKFTSFMDVDSLYPNLNDEFLMEVVPNCKFVEIKCPKGTTAFTFQGVVRMIAEILSRGALNRFVRLPDVQLNDIPLSEVEETLKAFHDECVYERYKSYQKLALYKLTFGRSNGRELVVEMKLPLR